MDDALYLSAQSAYLLPDQLPIPSRNLSICIYVTDELKQPPGCLPLCLYVSIHLTD